jgi:hypothetical protein
MAVKDATVKRVAHSVVRASQPFGHGNFDIASRWYMFLHGTFR